jgi:hypothetical protein
MQPIYTMQGIGEVLEVYNDRVKITPKGVLGFLSKGLKGTKELSIFSITSVQLKEASLLVNGYIQFSIPGGNESKKGIFDAVSDENTFMFSKGVNNNHHARVIKEYVFNEVKKQDHLNL